jgi:hypothetical protein
MGLLFVLVLIFLALVIGAAVYLFFLVAGALQDVRTKRHPERYSESAGQAHG